MYVLIAVRDYHEVACIKKGTLEEVNIALDSLKKSNTLFKNKIESTHGATFDERPEFYTADFYIF